MTALGMMLVLTLAQDAGAMQPMLRAVDLNVGETASVLLSDGSEAEVEVVDLEESRDDLRQAVRRAEVTVRVNGEQVVLTSANYRLPVDVGGVQIDCPITQGYRERASRDVWGLKKDVRLRLWPQGAPWIRPETFLYPVKQRWFANHTWMANEPVDAGENLLSRPIYYHWGLDIGGSEGQVEVVAATDGMVVSVADTRLDGIPNPLVGPRYDVVYIRDDRGWYYRYSHLKSIETAIRLGRRVRMGQPIGLIGKEGASGGWTHLHFDVSALQPSGEWGIQDGYAFIWEAYRRQFAPRVVAHARPRSLAWTSESIALDASRSWAASGIQDYEWTFSDGSTGQGKQVIHQYDEAGSYSERVKVTSSDGRVGYDFANVLVLDKQQPEPTPPRLHATYYPTFGIQAGDPVTFKVRCFEATEGVETWDFGDRTRPIRTRSDGNLDPHAVDGYAEVTHRFARPGHYLVHVQRTDGRNQTGHARLFVPVGPKRRVRYINPENSFANAVAVAGHTLAHTGQVLPVNAHGQVNARLGARQQLQQALRNLGTVLASAGTDLQHLVKINAYARTEAAAEVVQQALSRRFSGRRKPALSIVVSDLPHPDALVALDAVATTDRAWSPGVTGVERLKVRALPGAEADVSLLPPGETVYVSGQAGRGELSAASESTMKILGETLDYLQLGPQHVVQVKAFLQPMQEVETVRAAIHDFFSPGTIPPVVFVEWESSETLPVEIELIAWSGPGGESPGGKIEYLTPPGMDASPVYTRVVRISDLETIYVSGLHAEGDAEQQIRGVYDQLAGLLDRAGSDLKHLVKGTYYVADAEISQRFGELRKEIYDPRRPPAASKARVENVGTPGRRLAVDMIAVTPPEQ